MGQGKLMSSWWTNEFRISAFVSSLWQSYCVIFDPNSEQSDRICEIVDSAWLRLILRPAYHPDLQ